MTQEQIGVDEINVSRIVHFVRVDSYGKHVCRPAIVVEDWPGAGRPGYVNLQVFTDGSNDGEWGKPNVVWQTSVTPNHAARCSYTWHWPRECERMSDPPPSYKSKDGNTYQHNHIPGILDIHNCFACRVSEKDAEEAAAAARAEQIQ